MIVPKTGKIFFVVDAIFTDPKNQNEMHQIKTINFLLFFPLSEA